MNRPFMLEPDCMAIALAFLTVADLALLFVMVAGAGFVLQGVNNTGPMMPEAVVYVAVMVACLAAPALAWWGRRKWPARTVLVTAAMPLLIAGLALAAQPV